MASDWYVHLAPIFEYTAKQANEEADARVFYKEEIFPNHEDNAASMLRFCVPNKYFSKYDYVYFTDIDFIFLPQKPSLVRYHKHIIEETGEDNSAYRGRVIKNGKEKWVKDNTRIGAGGFMATPLWLEKTSAAREWYSKKYKSIPYREKDENVLYGIFIKSKHEIPSKEYCFVNNKKFDIQYRDVHLGDFKQSFKHRWSRIGKMRKRFLTDSNVGKTIDLFRDKHFRTLMKTAKQSSFHIKEMFNNLEWHLKERT